MKTKRQTYIFLLTILVFSILFIFSCNDMDSDHIESESEPQSKEDSHVTLENGGNSFDIEHTTREKTIQRSRDVTNEHSAEALSIIDVLDDPQKYSDKRIVIECYYFESFEAVVLASNVIINDKIGYWAKDSKIWATWATTYPKQIDSALKPIKGFSIHGIDPIYGHVQVSGYFRTGNLGGYGHMGEYEHLFEIHEMIILE